MIARLPLRRDSIASILASRARSAHWLVAPLSVFAGTRLVLFLVGYVSVILVPLNPTVKIRPVLESPLFVSDWLQGDVPGYLLLAQHGYLFDPASAGSSPLLLPVFPVLVSALGQVVGAPAAAIVIANVSSAIALVLLYRWISTRLDDDLARRAVLLLCVFPYAFLFAAADARSLELLFVVATLYCLERRRLLIAAVCAALGALTLPVGLALWPTLLASWQGFRPSRSGWSHALLLLASLAVAPLAVLAFGLYLHQGIGFPLGRIGDLLLGSDRLELATAPATYLRSVWAIPAGARLLLVFNLLLGAGALAATPAVYRQFGLPGATFGVGAILITLIARPGSVGVVVIFLVPLFVLIAEYVQSEMAEMIVIVTSALFLALLTALFVNWYGFDGNVELAQDWTSTTYAIAVYHAQLAKSQPAGRTTHDLLLQADDSLMIMGANLGTARAAPGGTLSVSLNLYVIRPTNKGYLLSVRLADRTGKNWAEVDKVLWGKADASLFNRREVPLLEQGRYLEDTLNLRLDPGIPTGEYSLDLTVFRLPSMATLPLRKLDGATPRQVTLEHLAVTRPGDLVSPDDVAVQHRVGADLGTEFSLLGDDVQPDTARAGGRVQVTLYWEARAKPDHDYTVFVQMLDPSGRLVAQSDGYPAGGRFPTTYLSPGQVLRDGHTLRIPAGLPAGRYQIIAGMYRLKTGQRLPVRMPGRSRESDHVELQTVTLRP